MRPQFPHEYLDFGDFQMVRVGREVTFGQVHAWFRAEGFDAGFRPHYERNTLDLYFRRDADERSAAA